MYRWLIGITLVMLYFQEAIYWSVILVQAYMQGIGINLPPDQIQAYYHRWRQTVLVLVFHYYLIKPYLSGL